MSIARIDHSAPCRWTALFWLWLLLLPLCLCVQIFRPRFWRDLGAALLAVGRRVAATRLSFHGFRD